MSKTRVSYRYSLAFKQKVVTEIEAGKYSLSRARQLYDIHGANTLYRWLRQLGKGHLIANIVKVQMKDEKDKLKELVHKNQQLESALAQAHLKLLMPEALLESVEAHYQVDVKKNFWFDSVQRAQLTVQEKGLNYSLSKLCGFFARTRQAFYKRTQHGLQRELCEQQLLHEVQTIRRRQPRVGTSFGLEIALVLLVLLSEIFLARRYWCKYVCPVGAMLAVFRWRRTMRLVYEESHCACHALTEPCHYVCPLQLSPKRDNVYPFCFNCGLCTSACEKTGKAALRLGFKRAAPHTRPLH